MKTLFTQIKPDSLSSEQIRTWDQAVANSDLPDPICNEYEWVMSYHTVDGLNRPALMLFEHGNMFSICEHHERDVTILAPLESGWLYDRPFLGADPIPLLFKAIDLLDDYYGQRNFPLMIFGGMSPHKPICNEILLNLGHLFNFYVQSDGCQGAASLEGGIDGFLSRRSSNFRSKLKKAVRKTKELGVSYEHRIPADPKEAMDIYQRMLAVEEKSWKGEIANGLLAPTSNEFYGQLIQNLSKRCKARVIFARHQEQDIGFIFGAVSGSIYRGQQFSYDLTYTRYSIGNTLQYAQLLWLAEEGVERYDMGPITGERMGYKEHWTELVFPIQTWILKRIGCN